MAGEYSAFKGRGIVYLEDDNGVLFDVGNCSAFGYGAEEESESQANYRTAAGGSYASDTRVSKVNLNLTMHDFIGRNLAIGSFGVSELLAEADIVDEAQTTPENAAGDYLVPTNRVIDTSQPVTVTGKNLGTDFEVSSAGVLVKGGGTIGASEGLAISYKAIPVEKVEVFVEAAKERRVVLAGLNSVKDGKPVRIQVYKGKFGASSENGFIADSFGSLPLTGEALPDLSITGTGLSQYLKVEAA